MRRHGAVLIRTAAAVLLIVTLLFNVPYSDAAVVDPISVTVVFDQDSYLVGSQINATYKITGGSGSYKSLEYRCYSWADGTIVLIKSGQLTGPSGTITYTPTIGQSTDIAFSGYDSEGRLVNVSSQEILLTNGPSVDTIRVSVVFDQESYQVGSTITANYTITGGSGSYNSLEYRCYSWADGTIVLIKSGQLTGPSGTITYTPTIGQSTDIAFSGYDSEGRLVNVSSQEVPLTGAAIVDPIRVSVQFYQKSYQVGTEVTARYTITGGSGSYRSLEYRCYSWADGTIVLIKSGQLTGASGTITYIPMIGQSTDIAFSGYDSEGRLISASSDEVPLFDCIVGNHDLEYYSRIEPKCVTAGHIEYWQCCLCHSKFSDKNATNEIVGETGLPPTGHNIITRSAIAPTYSRTGKTEGKYCSKCWMTFLAQETIPSLSSKKVLFLPSSLVTIEDEAFSNLDCAVVIIEEGCKTIGPGAFKDCSQLIYVKLPSTVSSISEDAFSGCKDNLFIDR